MDKWLFIGIMVFSFLLAFFLLGYRTHEQEDGSTKLVRYGCIDLYILWKLCLYIFFVILIVLAAMDTVFFDGKLLEKEPPKTNGKACLIADPHKTFKNENNGGRLIAAPHNDAKNQ